MTEIALFGSTFILVFALGLQSLNVNGGHYWWAFFTSFLIGGSNLVLFKLAPNANTTEALSYLLGGPFGIVASMYVHRRFITPKKAPDKGFAATHFEAVLHERLKRIDEVTVREVLMFFSVPRELQTREHTDLVEKTLRQLGWLRCRRTSGDREWFYRRPAAPTPPIITEGLYEPTVPWRAR